MKFFSEFGSCWGGVTVGSSADATAVRWRTDEQGRKNCHHTHSQSRSRRLAKVNPRGGGGATTHNWKPKLNAISENRPLPEVDRGGANQPVAGVDVKKRPVKAKPKSPARAASSPNHEDGYWKSSSHTNMALPAFSPTSFLF